jgi:hypothetical protein
MKRRTARLGIGPAAFAAVLIGAPIALMAQPVAAAPVLNYGPNGVGLTLSSSATAAGAKVSLHVTKSRTVEHYVVTMVGTSHAIGQTNTNAEGVAVTSVVIPRQTRAGEHTITLTGNKGNVVSAAIYVDATSQLAAAPTLLPTSHSGGGLNFTATDAVATGAGVVAIGGLIVLGVRRRRRSNWTN